MKKKGANYFLDKKIQEDKRRRRILSRRSSTLWRRRPRWRGEQEGPKKEEKGPGDEGSRNGEYWTRDTKSSSMWLHASPVLTLWNVFGNVQAPVFGFLLADPTSCGVYRQVVSQCTKTLEKLLCNLTPSFALLIAWWQTLESRSQPPWIGNKK